jgi:hypothetical protein
VVYRGRAEPILIGVLIVDAIATLGLATWLTWSAATGRMPSFFLFFGPSLVVSCAVAAWIILKTSYEIEGGVLVVRQGPNKKRIPVSSIDEVFPAKNNPLSPAWAADRLQVMFVPGTKAGVLFLAPEDRTGFMQALAEADPGLSYDGEKLSRGAPT